MRPNGYLERDCLKLPKSLETLGQADFSETLLDELHQQSSDLPLQDFLAEGGWPDEDSLKLSIESIEHRGRLTVVTVRCEFDECMQTGCADVHRSESAFGTFDVTLDPDNEQAYIVSDSN